MWRATLVHKRTFLHFVFEEGLADVAGEAPRTRPQRSASLPNLRRGRSPGRSDGERYLVMGQGPAGAGSAWLSKCPMSPEDSGNWHSSGDSTADTQSSGGARADWCQKESTVDPQSCEGSVAKGCLQESTVDPQSREGSVAEWRPQDADGWRPQAAACYLGTVKMGTPSQWHPWHVEDVRVQWQAKQARTSAQVSSLGARVPPAARPWQPVEGAAAPGPAPETKMWAQVSSFVSGAPPAARPWQKAEGAVAPGPAAQASLRSWPPEPVPKRKARPCKGKRDRLRRFVTRVNSVVDKDPESFDINAVNLPPSLVEDGFLRQKVFWRVERHREQALGQARARA